MMMTLQQRQNQELKHVWLPDSVKRTALVLKQLPAGTVQTAEAVAGECADAAEASAAAPVALRGPEMTGWALVVQTADSAASVVVPVLLPSSSAGLQREVNKTFF